ncbi:hypothetical protein [Arcanobacterium pinnipediorum]|uniref:Nucleotide modification associated domain-containing protein n=1 Tax=Arcanobacterium pinnipediorum TaxID=1503041 RepID=A0ABY5AIR0_9ACTO|nr:hypothetical protein [Arcanobacterium pinnipediorum]USR79870.1 hypothetical protein NG665_02485 [Arcanobacterium pinnipediorum]
MHNEKTTMEHLQMATDSYGAVIAYGDFVLASAYRHLGKGKTGNDARVYKLAQQPIPGWGPQARGFIECELDLVAEASELFADAGHAIAWALDHTN